MLHSVGRPSVSARNERIQGLTSRTVVTSVKFFRIFPAGFRDA